jgi:peptide/nickel transport system permease protein
MARAAPSALALAHDSDDITPRQVRDRSAEWLALIGRSPQLWIGGLILIVMVVCAALAPWIAPFSPSQMGAGPSLGSPSLSHWFGADKLGRDTLSRMLYGGRVSLSVSFAAVVLSLVVGVALGLCSGYWGGLVDSVLMRVMDGLLAFPGLILALTVAFALGPSVFSVIFALGIVRIPVFARIVRGQVLALRPQEFVVAAEVIGAPPSRVVSRYLLPNLVGIIIVQISLSAGAVIFAEASLGFLGLSVPPPTPTWGGMLHDGYAYLETSPWQSIIPGAIIFLAVLSFNFLGDGLQDILDPKRRRRTRG